MKRLCLAIAATTVILGACTGSSNTAAPTTQPPVQTTSAPSPTPVAASPAPGPQTIGDCTIEPNTDCRKDDLRKADLRGYDLRGANFSDANLSEALMHRTNLRDANLKNATLTGANLKDAHLENADISGANFSNTNVAYANFKDATATGANFDGAYRCGTVMSDGQIDNTSCEPKASPSPSTTTGGPTIEYFDIPASFRCYQDEEWLIEAKYGTKGATSVEITYQHEGDAATSGRIALEVPCKEVGGKPKTIAYTLTAKNNKGATSSKTEYLNLIYPYTK